jgi:ribonuclease HII
MPDIVAGLDEAGRGPVLGPMIVCGVAFQRENLRELDKMRVKDSKLLSPHRRSMLAKLIQGEAKQCELIEISAAEIDDFRLTKRIKLNQVEAMQFARVINRLKPSKVYVDSADTDPARFSRDIEHHLRVKTEIVAEHRADQKYPLVSAASIVAKVRRDQRIDELKKQHGELGSGYPSDARTIQFLERWVREHGGLPDFARRSWETARRVLAESAQRKLK